MANRYWVGGAAAWDGTAGTKWALTSGGAGGQAIPTSADDVFFDAASGANQVVISTGNTGAKSITCTGFTGTLNFNVAINVSGNVTFVSGMTTLGNGSLIFIATATLISATKQFNPVINGSGITVTLGDALNIGARVLTITQGTFTTSATNYSITAGSISMSGGTLTLNGSTVSLSEALGFSTVSGATINAGTSTINLSNTNAAFTGGGKTYNNVSFTSTGVGGVCNISDANTFSNLTLTAPATAGTRTHTFSGTQTITTFVCSGASAVRRVSLQSSTGSAITLTATTWTTVSDVDFRQITLTNAKSPTRGGDGGGNTNITFPAAKTVYWNLAGAQSWSATAWATTAGGAPAINNFPLAQDTATFTNTGSVTGTITADGGFYVGTVTMATRTTTMTLSISSTVVLGDWVNGSGTTIAGTGSLNFSKISGTQTITSAGKSFSANIYTGSGGATISLSDALTTTADFTCFAGLTLNNNTLTVNNFISNVTTGRTFAFGTGNITITGTGSSALNVGSAVTATGTKTVTFTYSGASAMTIATGTQSGTNQLNLSFTGGSYALGNTGTLYIGDLSFTGYAGTATLTASWAVYGNITLGAGMTLATGANTILLNATSGTKTITASTATITSTNLTFSVNGSGGTFQLQDSFSCGGVSLLDGTLDLNGQTLTTTSTTTGLQTAGAGTKNLTFNGGTLVITASANGAFNNAGPTGFTTTAGTGTGTIRMSSASAKTFVGGGSTFNCTLDQGGAGVLTITGANTFSNITNSYGATGATSILFTAGTTTTFADWNASGQSGRLLTIGSVTAASHTLSKSTGTVSANFLSVSRSTATGGATWYAGANSTNGGNNTGWLFSNAPSASGNFMMFFI